MDFVLWGRVCVARCQVGEVDTTPELVVLAVAVVRSPKQLQRSAPCGCRFVGACRLLCCCCVAPLLLMICPSPRPRLPALPSCLPPLSWLGSWARCCRSCRPPCMFTKHAHFLPPPAPHFVLTGSAPRTRTSSPSARSATAAACVSAACALAPACATSRACCAAPRPRRWCSRCRWADRRDGAAAGVCGVWQAR